MINRAILEQAIGAALRNTVDELDKAYTVAIETPIYNWPGSTLRQSGEIAGTTRNAVDLGEFRDSQAYSPLNPLLWEFSWDAPHSVSVFFGFTTESGNVYPPRNPVTEAHELIDPTELFAAYLRVAL